MADCAVAPTIAEPVSRTDDEFLCRRTPARAAGRPESCGREGAPTIVPMPYYESWVERQIREAMERGEFDDLPGAGKPLDLGDVDDPDWWVKRKMAAEGIEPGHAVSGPLALRREAATYPEALLDVRSADQVREIIRDYNRRVVADRLRPAVGRDMPAVAPRLDVEHMVTRWEALRAERAALRAAARPAPAPVEPRTRRRWWARLRGAGPTTRG